MKTLLLALIMPILAAGVSAATAPIPASPAPARGRVVTDWGSGWLFSKSDAATAMAPLFDDAGWKSVRVPHDWSTEEPFRAEYGSGNGYAAGGIAWYRKHFRLPETANGRAFTVEFDGVYAFAQVWINGHYVGGRPYGYSSFAFELTPHLKIGSGDNVLAVRVDHSRFADSRWYTGSGIYRRVRLVETDVVRVAHWGTFVTTPSVATEKATVRVETTIQNGSADARSIMVQCEILDAGGSVLGEARANVSLEPRKLQSVVQDLQIDRPRLWSPNTPNLYLMRTRLLVGSSIRDETSTRFGIRTIAFDADRGFTLNGESMKFKGVCLHHDAGPLGAAVPEAVWRRRLIALKEIGVNAIRTSHNPPSPELLHLCDEIGFLVQDEALDEFTPTKKKWVSGWNNGQPGRFGAGEFFPDWGVRDTADMVRRDRNHPSIVMWSVGNEIDYPNDPFSHPALGERYTPINPRAENLNELITPLVAAVKAHDTTRPVTAALASIVMSNAVGLPEKLDIVGYNYQEANYAADHASYPKRVIYGSENGHGYAAWLAVRDNPHISGQFLWTGYDYLGEAGLWPVRANGAGLFDLCGFKKPMAWFRESLWSEKPMVYIAVDRAGGARGRRSRAVEAWTGTEGANVDVIGYTNCTEVELLLNEKSLGVKPASAAVNGVLRWMVPYAAGALKAVGRKDGREVCNYVLETTGPEARLELVAQPRTNLKSDGGDICEVEVRVVDAKGRRIVDARTAFTLTINGPVELLALGNGDLANAEDCADPAHAMFEGRAKAFLRTTTSSGEITIEATANGLEPAVLKLTTGR